MKKILALLMTSLIFLASCSVEAPQEGNLAQTEVAAEQTESKKEEVNATDKKEAGKVILYTSRHYDTDKELFEKFKAETGITVEVKKADAKALLEEISKAGNEPIADLFYTADAGKLAEAKDKGLFQTIGSEILKAQVPEKMRDPDDQWTALTMRARIIAYAKDRVNPEMLSTYEDLADPKWKGKIAVRPSSHVYNQSLVASFIEIMGEEETAKWLKGFVANLARDPKGNDRDQVKAVAANEADIAIVNSYYIGKMLTSEDAAEKEAVAKVGVFFPNQKTTGTHINVSGAGILKNAPNKANAVKLLEFLSGETAQADFASANNEFPVNPKVKTNNPLLLSWGEFKIQDIPLSALGKNNKKAQQLMDEADWK